MLFRSGKKKEKKKKERKKDCSRGSDVERESYRMYVKKNCRCFVNVKKETFSPALKQSTSSNLDPFLPAILPSKVSKFPARHIAKSFTIRSRLRDKKGRQMILAE